MESLRVTVPEIWPGQNRGGKNKKQNKKNNEANWMVSNSAKLDRRTKQHTQFGVSASNGSRDMARTKSWQKKKGKNEREQTHIASPTGIANNELKEKQKKETEAEVEKSSHRRTHVDMPMTKSNMTKPGTEHPPHPL